MSDLSKKYQNVINNIEEKLKGKEEIEYVKGQIDELLNTFSRRN